MITQQLTTPAGHGPDLDYIAPGRHVLTVPGRVWAYRPEECPMGDLDSEWINDGAALVCIGCGLDGT